MYIIASFVKWFFRLRCTNKMIYTLEKNWITEVLGFKALFDNTKHGETLSHI
jgi:hypothetical protein